jgi:hypothetical protein
MRRPSDLPVILAKVEVGRLKEIGLIDGFQGHPNRFLNDPIADGRNAQGAKLSTRFRLIFNTTI